MRRGKYMRLHADQWTYAFGRRLEEDRLIVAVKVADREQTIRIPINALFADDMTLEAVYGNAKTAVEGGMVEVTIPARDGLILTAESLNASQHHAT